jgi:aminopeptidase N
MPDTLASPATPHVTRREDYRPPEWLVPDVTLDFALGAERTIVRARLEVTRNGEHSAPLRLNASGLSILDVRLDGEPVN